MIDIKPVLLVFTGLLMFLMFIIFNELSEYSKGEKMHMLVKIPAVILVTSIFAIVFFYLD